ncbi:heavy-metal-associated domain-containing protein [Azospirillum halopraeferens]|uniref:heavy-metal-associated domain-containing protein n=1 Tax=Azospirillum halopraeferens TaxID=34010 RepID=UPI0004062008|nr:heavy-metal-associated domain-containing protein [Azospirillum halopraeferens]
MAETFRVDGMTCGGCARSVTNAIVKLVPQARVEVDLPSGTVAVDGASDDEVQRAVESAGFDFRGKAA